MEYEKSKFSYHIYV